MAEASMAEPANRVRRLDVSISWLSPRDEALLKISSRKYNHALQMRRPEELVHRRGGEQAKARTAQNRGIPPQRRRAARHVDDMRQRAARDLRHLFRRAGQRGSSTTAAKLLSSAGSKGWRTRSRRAGCRREAWAALVARRSARPPRDRLIGVDQMALGDGEGEGADAGIEIGNARAGRHLLEGRP